MVLMALAAGACAGGPPAGTPHLSVDFTWTGIRRCVDTSPRIVVRDIPPAARRLHVELVDIDSAFSDNGGGDVDVPRDGVIPPGALAHYRGPCPQQTAIAYEMRVTALDASGKVLAYGMKAESFAPPGSIRKTQH
jgi:hypothetical protein